MNVTVQQLQAASANALLRSNAIVLFVPFNWLVQFLWSQVPSPACHHNFHLKIESGTSPKSMELSLPKNVITYFTRTLVICKQLNSRKFFTQAKTIILNRLQDLVPNKKGLSNIRPSIMVSLILQIFDNICFN